MTIVCWATLLSVVSKTLAKRSGQRTEAAAIVSLMLGGVKVALISFASWFSKRGHSLSREVMSVRLLAAPSLPYLADLTRTRSPSSEIFSYGRLVVRMV